jgi:hypothetical protein
MLEEVRAGDIDIVVCESLDRLARDGEDVSWIGKKLRFDRVTLYTVSEREIDDIKLAVAAMLGTIFPSNLQQKTIRGMEAAVLAGRFAGGRAYGYRKVHKAGPIAYGTSGGRPSSGGCRSPHLRRICERTLVDRNRAPIERRGDSWSARGRVERLHCQR